MAKFRAAAQKYHDRAGSFHRVRGNAGIMTAGAAMHEKSGGVILPDYADLSRFIGAV